MAEEDADVEQEGETDVVCEEQVIVGRDGFQFREAFLDLAECPFHVRNGHRQNALDERDAAPAVNHGQEDTPATLARDNEVCLAVPDARSFVDIPGPFVDEGAAKKVCGTGTSTGSSTPLSSAMCFNTSSVWTFDIPIQRVF